MARILLMKDRLIRPLRKALMGQGHQVTLAEHLFEVFYPPSGLTMDKGNKECLPRYTCYYDLIVCRSTQMVVNDLKLLESTARKHLLPPMLLILGGQDMTKAERIKQMYSPCSAILLQDASALLAAAELMLTAPVME